MLRYTVKKTMGNFQSTRPLRGETITSAFIWFSVSSFQSTRPLRGETETVLGDGLTFDLSIHSPLAGRDAYWRA